MLSFLTKNNKKMGTHSTFFENKEKNELNNKKNDVDGYYLFKNERAQTFFEIEAKIGKNEAITATEFEFIIVCLQAAYKNDKYNRKKNAKYIAAIAAVMEDIADVVKSENKIFRKPETNDWLTLKDAKSIFCDTIKELQNKKYCENHICEVYVETVSCLANPEIVKQIEPHLATILNSERLKQIWPVVQFGAKVKKECEKKYAFEATEFGKNEFSIRTATNPWFLTFNTERVIATTDEQTSFLFCEAFIATNKIQNFLNAEAPAHIQIGNIQLFMHKVPMKNDRDMHMLINNGTMITFSKSEFINIAKDLTAFLNKQGIREAFEMYVETNGEI